MEDTACLAHEVAHVRQFEQWGAARYFLRGAVDQLRHLLFPIGLAENPYDWRRVSRRPFGEYGMEQQAQIVEDAVRGDGEAGEIWGGEK